MNYEKAERDTQQEPHFRKFESWIARACKGTIVIDPLTDFPGSRAMRTSTLKFYLREALLSYRRNKWPSSVIPIGYDMEKLQVAATKNEQVVIENRYQDRLNKQEQDEASVTIRDGHPVYWKAKQKPEKWMVYGIDCNEEIFAKLLIRTGAEKPEHDGIFVPVLVPPDFAKVKEEHRLAQRCEWEPLAEGWWRVM